jgi:outer membrane lipoprotein-sorting protein
MVLLAQFSGCCAGRFVRPSTLIQDAVTMSQEMTARGARIESFEYSTRVEYYGKEGAQKGKVDIIGHRSKGLRFEVLSPTDDTLALLVTDGKRFMSHERGKAVCYVGQACAANVSRLLPVEFTQEQWFNLLTGGVPFIDYSAKHSEWDDCEGGYLLTLKNPEKGLIQKIWLNPSNFLPFLVTVQRGGKDEYQLTYDRVTEVNGIPVPRRIQFKSDKHAVDLSMEIRELWLNQVADDRLYKVQCPSGTQQEELICR